MGALKTVSAILKACGGPIDILEDWAREPLKRWENEREQVNRDREVEREIRK